MQNNGTEDVLCSPQDNKMKTLVVILQDRLQRPPTEDEVWRFINGTTTQRQGIWNSR